jgi:molybdate transport system substrate-binding protein
MKKFFEKLIFILTLICSFQSWSAEVLIAVAANFAAPVKKISISFEQDTGNKVNISIGSTGKFYTQIRNGGPYQVLLAADDETPAKLVSEGFAEPASRFNYATGKLVLWSKQPSLVDDKGEILKKDTFKHIAIADPKLAPYGLAAMETLAQLGLDKVITPRAVWGENIGQTYLYVESQSVDLGFVALSQIYVDGRIREGSAWIVPESMHSPIKQDAVLLSAGKNNPAAGDFLAYLKGRKAKDIIKSYGYDL